MQISLFLSPGTWQNTNRMWKQKTERQKKVFFFLLQTLFLLFSSVLSVRFSVAKKKKIQKWKHNQSIFIFRTSFSSTISTFKIDYKLLFMFKRLPKEEKNAKELLNGIEWNRDIEKECLEWLVEVFELVDS